MDPQATVPPPPFAPVMPIAPAPVVSPSHPKWPWILGGLVLLVLGGVGGIFLGKYLAYSTPAPSPVATVPTTATDSIPVMYNNDLYGFYLQFPIGLNLVKNDLAEPYYDPVVTAAASDYSVSVRVIHEIDIYQTALVETVAGREYGDAGFKITTTLTIINDYPSVTIETDTQDPNLIAIIKKPNQNIFVEITGHTISKEVFDQILSTFKFTN